MTNSGTIVPGYSTRLSNPSIFSSPAHSVPLHLPPHPPHVFKPSKSCSETNLGGQRLQHRLSDSLQDWTWAQCWDHTNIPTSPCPRQGSRIFTLNCTRQRINSNSHGPINLFKESKEAFIWDEGAVAMRIGLKDPESSLFGENTVTAC